MKRKITAVALGAGLVFGGTACTGESSPEPPPTPFAGSLRDRPEACPGGTGQQMPSIVLKGDMFAKADLWEIASNSDSNMQTSLCKTAIRIGNALLEAVNHHDPNSGFDVGVYDSIRGDKEISARKKGQTGEYRSISASYATSLTKDPSKPAEVVAIDGVWGSADGNMRSIVSLIRFRLREGGEGWYLESRRTEGDKKESLIDPMTPIATLPELDIHIDKTATALFRLGQIPTPPPFSVAQITTPPSPSPSPSR